MIDHGPSANDASYGSAYDLGQERTQRKIISLALTVLAHLLVLWAILAYKPALKIAAKGENNPITYILDGASKPDQAKARPKAAEAPPKQKPTQKTTPPPISPPISPPIVTPPVAVEAPPPPAPEAIRAPEVDMSAMIDSRRRQRAEQRPDPGEAEESADDRARRIAKANATVSSGARGRNEASGVFEIKQLGVIRGAFAFNGWSTQRGRIAQQLIEVEASNGGSVKQAMVKRMIELIREEKVDEFTWDSRRLGRQVRLSSKKEFEPELTRFLLLEFFNE